MAEEHFDSSGNVQVDFVWGNLPMQPNYGRNDSYQSFGGGYNSGDNNWNSTDLYGSDTLNTSYTAYLNDGWITKTVGTNHTMVYDGWSNFPGFIPDYAGDEDSELETTVPTIVGGSLWDAEEKLDAAYLDYDWDWVYPGGPGLTTDGETATLYMDGDFWYSEGLKKDDILWLDWYDGDSSYSRKVKVLSKDGDAETLQLEFLEPFEYSYDGEVFSAIYAGEENVYGRVLSQDRPPFEGDIVDEGTGIYFYILGD